MSLYDHDATTSDRRCIDHKLVATDLLSMDAVTLPSFMSVSHLFVVGLIYSIMHFDTRIQKVKHLPYILI